MKIVPMKAINSSIFTVWVILTFGYSIQAQNKTNIDVSHYRFDLDISDRSDTLWGTAVIDLSYLANTTSISFDLRNIDSSGKGMYIIAVTKDAEKLAYHHHNDKLLIQLPAEAVTGDSQTFSIQYAGIPSDGLIISKNMFGKRTFFGDNWPNRARYWLPCNDIPADKASLEFRITAPAHYNVISNGVKIEERFITDNTKRTHWKEEVPLPTKVMVFGAADFKVSEAAYTAGIPVTSWVFADQKGFHDYELARDILSFYINYIGPFGYKKLANVQSKTRFGGMENAGAIFYFERSVQGKGALENLLAHEIAHQWFGDMVTESDFKHVWLSEGFATYMTCLYIESRYGADSLHKVLQANKNAVIGFAARTVSPVIDTTSNLMRLLNANSYQKGGWVLHMLRNKIGDELFQKVIREFYQQYAGSNASTEDFMNIAASVSNKDLKNFFMQWLYKPGHPVIKVSWKTNVSGKKISCTIEQQQDGLFNFPLELQIRTQGQDLLKTQQIKKRRTKIKIRVKSPATQIITDPNGKLLFENYEVKN